MQEGDLETKNDWFLEVVNSPQLIASKEMRPQSDNYKELNSTKNLNEQRNGFSPTDRKVYSMALLNFDSSPVTSC